MSDKKRELPDLTTEPLWRIRGQMAGALAMLRQDEASDNSETMQTCIRLLEVGIEETDQVADVVDEYTSIVGHREYLLRKLQGTTDD